MSAIVEIFERLDHLPIYELLGQLGLEVSPNARTTLSDWSWKAPSGLVISLWLDDTIEEDGTLRQRHNLKKWARERAANTMTANRALRYDLALREVYYRPGRSFRVILLEADHRRGKGGWTESSVASRKALDPMPWRIVEASTQGDWTLERGVGASRAST